MIRKIYSKKDPKLLLHIIYTYNPASKITEKKVYEISEPEHFLQAIHIEAPENTCIKPHFHNKQNRLTEASHEGLLVFRGSIELSIFDIDNSLVEKITLKEGDCYILVNGGHSIRTLEPSKLFEFKNGPFIGSDNERTYFS